MMKKLFCIGATLIVMGFVACSQSNQPTLDVNATGTVLETTATKNDDLDAVDFETSSTGEEIDEDTKGKLKKSKARFNHKFSNGAKIALYNSSSGITLLRTEHSQIVSVTKDLPDFISEQEKKIKSTGLGAKAVSIYPNGGSAGGPWPGYAIPYIIDSGFSASELAVISRAIVLWNENINAKYVPHSGQWDAVRIRPTDTNSKTCQASWTGKGPGSGYLVAGQLIELKTGTDVVTGQKNCASDLGVVLHEMAHTAGLYHEQQRCDRDQFVRVEYSTLSPGDNLNFGRLCFPLAQDVEPFDYTSTMAYPYNVYGSAAVVRYPSAPNTGYNYIGDWTNLGRQSRISRPLGIDFPFLSQADVIALNRIYPAGTNAPMGVLAGQFAGEAHSSNIGWQSWVAAATYPATTIEIGATGQNLEALRLSTYRVRRNLMIAYSTHVSYVGWQNSYSANGELAGTTGRGYPIEAIKVSLYGDSSGCTLTYRTKARNGNWSAYGGDNTVSGSVGLGIPLEKIGLRLQCN
jgi:hypothetical protein